MTKTMLPVLKVSLTHIMCSISVCQIHEETAEWLNECVLMNFFTENRSLLHLFVWRQESLKIPADIHSVKSE